MRALPFLVAAAAPCHGSQQVAHPHPAAEPDIVAGEYIVVLHPNVTDAKWAALHTEAAPLAAAPQWHALRRLGFAAAALRLSPAEAGRWARDPLVAYVARNAKVHLAGLRANATRRRCPDTQHEPVSWGQVRTTVATAGDVAGVFAHDAQWGEGVDIYVTDTGTDCAHAEFAGGDAKCVCGPTYSGGTDGCSDGHGHGTYCASIAAGRRYGVAKGARVIGIKVMSDAGTGTLSGIISGFNYIAREAASSGRRSVGSVSLGTAGAHPSLDSAADALAREVQMAIAASNSGEDPALADTCTGSSPGAATLPITVGSTALGGVPSRTAATDQRSPFSNYGPCVDLFAPGSDIVGAWVPGHDTYRTASGTSAATPHVAGAVAAWLTEHPTGTPAEAKHHILSTALADVVDLDCPQGGQLPQTEWVLGGGGIRGACDDALLGGVCNQLGQYCVENEWPQDEGQFREIIAEAKAQDVCAVVEAGSGSNIAPYEERGVCRWRGNAQRECRRYDPISGRRFCPCVAGTTCPLTPNRLLHIAC